MQLVSTQQWGHHQAKNENWRNETYMEVETKSHAYCSLQQRFSNFFQVGTTFISQSVLRTTLLLSP
jgi:hypothetical protein